MQPIQLPNSSNNYQSDQVKRIKLAEAIWDTIPLCDLRPLQLTLSNGNNIRMMQHEQGLQFGSEQVHLLFNFQSNTIFHRERLSFVYILI